MCVCVYVHACTCACACLYVLACLLVRMCVYMCMCMCVSVYVSACVCMYDTYQYSHMHALYHIRNNKLLMYDIMYVLIRKMTISLICDKSLPITGRTFSYDGEKEALQYVRKYVKTVILYKQKY